MMNIDGRGDPHTLFGISELVEPDDGFNWFSILKTIAWFVFLIVVMAVGLSEFP